MFGSAEYIERFWSKVEKTDGCWNWTGGLNEKGYGRAAVGAGRRAFAHRASWALHNGTPIPDGMCILHECDNPRCVNPAHLRLGTKLENNADMAARGRASSGERRYNAKLTARDVRDLRSIYAAGGVSQHELARRYGVSAMAINRAINGTRWRLVA